MTHEKSTAKAAEPEVKTPVTPNDEHVVLPPKNGSAPPANGSFAIDADRSKESTPPNVDPNQRSPVTPDRADR
jgi:hypothetical protein